MINGERVTAVIAAAGSGTRMGGNINKVFMPFGGKTVIERTLSVFEQCEEIDDIVIVTRSCDVLECMEYTESCKKRIRIIPGGAQRQESVKKGIEEAKASGYAVIHDGARAFVTKEIIQRTLMDAVTFGAAAPGVMCKDTLKRISGDGFIKETIDRESVCLIQTPQIFKTEEIRKAHELAEKDNFSATDDCALYEKYIGRVKLTEGSYENIKLTTPEDIAACENILRKRNESV